MKDLIELVLERKNITQSELCKVLNVSPATIKRAKGSLCGFLSENMKEKLRIELEKMIDKPIETEEQYNIRQERALYRTQERNRLLNKSNRELKKTEFTLQDFLDGVIEAVGCFKKEPVEWNTVEEKKEGKGLVVQLSDLHIGSIVDLKSNKYDISIARKRLMEYAQVIIDKVKQNNVDEIVVAITGDTVSLDFRMSQALTMERTRAECFVQTFDILCDFLDRLIVLAGCKIRVVGVLSNESRLKAWEKPTMVDGLDKDSFDYIIHQMLKRTYSNHDNITFDNDCDTLEYMFKIKNKNILALHGHTIASHNDKMLTTVRFNQMIESGILPDYIIFGHIHNPMISSFYGRSGSLKGSNEYSKNALTIVINKPSQNLYLVDDTRIIPMVIDFE